MTQNTYSSTFHEIKKKTVKSVLKASHTNANSGLCTWLRKCTVQYAFI